jgi:hypothetical protein
MDFLSLISMLVVLTFFPGNESAITAVFYVSRVLNGWCGAGLLTTTGYVLKLKLLKIKDNAKLNGTMESIHSSLKYVMPMVGAFSSDLIEPRTPIFIGIFLTIISFVYLIKNRRSIHFNYVINLKKSAKKNNHNIMDGIKTYLRKDKYRPVRTHFVLNNFLRNSVRPMFDFYIPVILISAWGFKVSEVAFISSWLILGQILQFTSAGLLRKIGTGNYQMISNFLLFLPIYIMATNEGVLESIALMSMLMFLVGYSGGMLSNWQYKMTNRISQDGIKISHTSLITQLSGGISYSLSALIIGVLSSYTNSFELVEILFLSVVSTLLVLSVLEILMDRRYRKEKKQILDSKI